MSADSRVLPASVLHAHCQQLNEEDVLRDTRSWSTIVGMPMLRDDEREAWRGFLAAAPEFAGDPIGSAVDGPDPPDVLCVTRSGKKVGVELTKWVEHEQITLGKARELFEDSYLHIIESANYARPDRIGWVWLNPKSRRVKPGDVSQFRDELYEFLARENGLSDPEWDHPQGAAVQDFIGFPVLDSYLESLWIFPCRKMEFLAMGVNWITFEGPGGAYTPLWMVQAAVDRMSAKVEDYEHRNLLTRHALDELYLVCHYSDEALLYNTPAHAPGFDFASVGSRVANVFAKDHGVFNRIFLFNPYEARKVLQVYPARVPNKFVVAR